MGVGNNYGDTVSSSYRYVVAVILHQCEIAHVEISALIIVDSLAGISEFVGDVNFIVGVSSDLSIHIFIDHINQLKGTQLAFWKR